MVALAVGEADVPGTLVGAGVGEGGALQSFVAGSK
jgi:hypothetical protein